MKNLRQAGFFFTFFLTWLAAFDGPSLAACADPTPCVSDSADTQCGLWLTPCKPGDAQDPVLPGRLYKLTGKRPFVTIFSKEI
jgi:hypothetical protein